MSRLKELPISTKTGWPWNDETSPEKYAHRTDWPKITIVTPSYNQSQFIEETLRSILLQNYPNLEYIIMDGGSTDNTLSVIGPYKQWIDVSVSEKDEGQSHAIEKGFNLAKGEILNWINSDDILCKDGLFHIASAFLDQKNADFVYGKNGIMNIDSERYGYMPHPKDNLNIRYLYEMPYGQQAIFFKKSLYVSCGGVNKDLRFSMDYELYIRMHLVGAKAVQIDDLIGNIRIHDSTKTSKLEEVMHEENGNAFMTLLKSVGMPSFVRFMEKLGHRTYKAYTVNIEISKKEVKRAFLQYLNKNVWYYYNNQRRDLAKKMAIKIIMMDPSQLLNFNLLKIIKDGIR